jgi:hypothetical protein
MLPFWRLEFEVTHRFLENLCTLEITPWSKVLLEKLIVPHLVKKFSAYYGAVVDSRQGVLLQLGGWGSG